MFCCRYFLAKTDLNIQIQSLKSSVLFDCYWQISIFESSYSLVCLNLNSRENQLYFFPSWGTIDVKRQVVFRFIIPFISKVIYQYIWVYTGHVPIYTCFLSQHGEIKFLFEINNNNKIILSRLKNFTVETAKVSSYNLAVSVLLV